jgi:hypothetical protein
MGIAKFERFFRVTAGINVDKAELKRYSDFVKQKIYKQKIYKQKIYDLLIRGQATAKANDRLIIEPFDLPITKGCRSASTGSGVSTWGSR